MPLPTLHRAAVEGDAEAVARLLADSADAAELAAAATDDELGMTALDFAAFKGHSEIVRLLLAAAPPAPARPRVSSPLHWAARGGCQATVRLLLEAAAPLATAADDAGCLPLHWAAQYCHEGVARLLLDAAPQAAAVRDLRGRLPLDALLANSAPGSHSRPGAALATPRALLAAPGQSASALLQSLAMAKASSLACQLYAEVVANHACHLGDWQLVPLACPGLAAALPAVLQRSEWEATQLTRRLPAAEAQRLQVAALALNRAQACAGLPLPQPLVWRILAHAFAG